MTFVPGICAAEITSDSAKNVATYEIVTDDLLMYGENNLIVSSTYDGLVTSETERCSIEQDFVRKLFNSNPSIHGVIVEAYYNSEKLGSESDQTHIIKMGKRICVTFNEDGSIDILTMSETPTTALKLQETRDGWQYTGTAQVRKFLYTAVGNVNYGTIMLEGYFMYNNVDTPEGYLTQTSTDLNQFFLYDNENEYISYYYNTKMCALNYDVHTFSSLAPGIILNGEHHLKIYCDKDGNITN